MASTRSKWRGVSRIARIAPCPAENPLSVMLEKRIGVPAARAMPASSESNAAGSANGRWYAPDPAPRFTTAVIALSPCAATACSGSQAAPWKWMTSEEAPRWVTLVGTCTETGRPAGPSNETVAPESGRGASRSCGRVVSTIGDGFCAAGAGALPLGAGDEGAAGTQAAAQRSESRARGERGMIG